MSETLLVESRAGVVYLTLNRPEKRNALSLDLLTELEQAIETIASDLKARVVVLGGAARFSRPGTISPRWSAGAPILIASYSNCARG